MELTAFEIAARLAKFIHVSFKVELTIDETYLWTDSQLNMLTQAIKLQQSQTLC